MNTTYLKRNSYKIFALCFFAYTIIYIGRKNFGACMNAMIGEGLIDKAYGGAILTAFLAAYAIGQMVNGVLGDRFHPGNMMTVGLMGAGCVNVAMGLNNIPGLFIVLWCMCGAFCSMLWSPLVRCIAEWMPDEYRTQAGTNISPTIPLGTVISYLLCSLLLGTVGWRAAFIVCGCILIASSILFRFGIRMMRSFIGEMEKINRESIRKNTAAEEKSHGRLSIVGLIISFGVSFTAIGILFNGILKDGLESWVPTFITSAFGASESLASLLTAILPIISLAGAYFAKWMYKRFFKCNEMLTSGVLFGISTVLMVPIIILTTIDTSVMGDVAKLILMIVSVVFIGAVIALMLGVNTLYLTFIPLCFGKIGRASSITGLLNAFSYGAAALSGIAIGFISQNFSWTVTISMFTLAALLGTVAGFAGSGVWKRGKDRLSAGE